MGGEFVPPLVKLNMLTSRLTGTSGFGNWL